MRLSKLTTLITIGALLLIGIPAFADSFTTFAQPTAAYTGSTTNFGGGDGSLNQITSLGPFTFSNPQTEVNVPNSWATWNCPPFTESCFPNALWNTGFSTLTITFAPEQIMGFELEPDNFAQEEVTAQFFDGANLVGTIDLFPNGSAGALLFAAQTDGQFTKVVITDLAGGDFAIAQLRSGVVTTTPEPSTLLLLGTGLLGALGAIRRKMNL
ncbi:MAG: PEP-CTERM sorting domain-containing protein [Candidatus Korobacteraceae bacterium]